MEIEDGKPGKETRRDTAQTKQANSPQQELGKRHKNKGVQKERGSEKGTKDEQYLGTTTEVST